MSLSPFGVGDPMCVGCRCLVTSPPQLVQTRDGPMHADCRADAYRDVACRTLDKAEIYARGGKPLPPDEIAAMTERIAALNPVLEECKRNDL